MTQHRVLAAVAVLASACLLVPAGPVDASALRSGRGVAAWRSGSTHVAALDAAGKPVAVSQQAASRDGRYVAFLAGRVYLRDRVTGTVRQIDLGPDGEPVPGFSESLRITPSGRYVFFATGGFGPPEEGEPQPPTGSYRYDRLTGQLLLFEVGTFPVAVSDDGAYAATVRSTFKGFVGSQVAAVEDPRGAWFIPQQGPPPTDPDFVPETAALDLSGDGRCVLAHSNQPYVAQDTNLVADLYVFNRATSVVTLVTAAADGTATGTSPGLLTGASADLSDDCSTVAFTVPADSAGTGGAVVAGTGGVVGSYVRTLATGRTRRVSVDSAGRALATPLTGMQLSAHARSLVFATAQPGVVAGDTNGVSDVFLRDLRQRSTVRISVPDRSLRPRGRDRQGNGPSDSPQLTRDSRHLVFLSRATNLAPEASTATYDPLGLVRTQGRR